MLCLMFKFVSAVCLFMFACFVFACLVYICFSVVLFSNLFHLLASEKNIISNFRKIKEKTWCETGVFWVSSHDALGLCVCYIQNRYHVYFDLFFVFFFIPKRHWTSAVPRISRPHARQHTMTRLWQKTVELTHKSIFSAFVSENAGLSVSSLVRMSTLCSGWCSVIKT